MSLKFSYVITAKQHAVNHYCLWPYWNTVSGCVLFCTGVKNIKYRYLREAIRNVIDQWWFSLCKNYIQGNFGTGPISGWREFLFVPRWIYFELFFTLSIDVSMLIICSFLVISCIKRWRYGLNFRPIKVQNCVFFSS